MYLIYNLILLFFFPIVLFYSYIFLKKEKFREHFGNLKISNNKKHIWIHAVSVGEIMAAIPIIKELKTKCPQENILVSVTTTLGYKIALKKFDQEIKVIFAPLDFPWVLKKTINQINPKILCILETEIWPNLLQYTSKKKIPILMLNGRIYKKDVTRYKLLSSFFKTVLKNFSFCAMQTEQDKKWIIEIGASKEKISVFGNSKFDILSNEIKPLFTEYQFKKCSFEIIVAGSTHQKEDEIIINTYNKIKNENIKLIIAPRHFNRIPELEKYCKKLGLTSCRKTQNIDIKNIDVVILDTIGELMSAYKIADVVFVGGSLVPVGGHNVMEPAVLGKPIIFGPYMENFEEIKNLLLLNNGAKQIKTEEELKKELVIFLSDIKKRNIIGENARLIIKQNQGASLKYANLIIDFLKLC